MNAIMFANVVAEDMSPIEISLLGNMLLGNKAMMKYIIDTHYKDPLEVPSWANIYLNIEERKDGLKEALEDWFSNHDHIPYVEVMPKEDRPWPVS